MRSPPGPSIGQRNSGAEVQARIARICAFGPSGWFYLGFFAGSAGRATPHGSYFSLGSGILSSAALYAFSSTGFRGSAVEPGADTAVLLRMRRHRDQSQHRHRHYKGLHRLSPCHPGSELTLRPDHGKSRIGPRRAR